MTKPIAQVQTVHGKTEVCLQPNPPPLEPRFAPKISGLATRVVTHFEWLLVLITAVAQRESIVHCIPHIRTYQGRGKRASPHIPTSSRPCRMLCISALHSSPNLNPGRPRTCEPSLPLIFRNIAFLQRKCETVFFALLDQTNALA